MISFLPIIFYDSNTNLTANSILNYFFLLLLLVSFPSFVLRFERQFAADVYKKKLEMENFVGLTGIVLWDCIAAGNPVKEKCDELIFEARSTTAIVCCRFISMQFSSGEKRKQISLSQINQYELYLIGD